MAKKYKDPILKLDVLEKHAVDLYGVLSNEQHDMPCVSISIAYLDQCLRSLLSKFLIDGRTADSMLGHKGALGTFDSRADLAYCLGLISKGLFKNLQLLGEMRNQIAHSYLQVSFGDSEIAELCSKLTFPQVTGRAQNKETGEWETVNAWPPEFSSTPRRRFIFIVAMMATRLTGTVASTEKRERRLHGWD